MCPQRSRALIRERFGERPRPRGERRTESVGAGNVAPDPSGATIPISASTQKRMASTPLWDRRWRPILGGIPTSLYLAHIPAARSLAGAHRLSEKVVDEE